MKTWVDVQGVSIVLLGSFNPSVFQPAWFAHHGLIRDAEAEHATIHVIRSDVASFKSDWLLFQSIPDRVTAETTQEPYYEILRDMVVGMLKLVPGTPLHAMGINRNVHFACESEAVRATIGERLAPPSVWNGLIDEPRMRSLTMEVPHAMGPKGYVRIKVEPSERAQNGVFIQKNDHYDLTRDAADSAAAAVEVLQTLFDETLRDAERIANGVMQLGGP